MRLDIPSTALVIVGGWNIHIFTAEWVKRYLLPREKEDLKVEYHAQPLLGLDTQFISPRISSDEVRISLLGSKLFFAPVRDEDRILDHLQELAVQLADYLPHTPVTGYGVNVAFTEEVINKDLVDSIRPSDTRDIEEFGVSITDEQYKRSLVLDGNVLNLTVEITADRVGLRFNFHTDIQNLVEFKSIITANPIRASKKKAIDFIAKIYGLELET